MQQHRQFAFLDSKVNRQSAHLPAALVLRAKGKSSDPLLNSGSSLSSDRLRFTAERDGRFERRGRGAGHHRCRWLLFRGRRSHKTQAQVRACGHQRRAHFAGGGRRRRGSPLRPRGRLQRRLRAPWRRSCSRQPSSAAGTKAASSGGTQVSDLKHAGTEGVTTRGFVLDEVRENFRRTGTGIPKRLRSTPLGGACIPRNEPGAMNSASAEI